MESNWIEANPPSNCNDISEPGKKMMNNWKSKQKPVKQERSAKLLGMTIDDTQMEKPNSWESRSDFITKSKTVHDQQPREFTQHIEPKTIG